MQYNWQQPDWPKFTYSLQEIEDILFAFAEETGYISGILASLPDHLQSEAILNTMVAEAIKSSAIEGEYLSREDVLSSIRNNLDKKIPQQFIKDKKAQGAGELMVAVRNSFTDRLTTETLLSWHTILMRSYTRINVGVWRTHQEPMQVVSGTIGKEIIHFEAPPSAQVPDEMNKFIQWFNDTAPGGNKEIKKAPLRSAIAHLYFESIHPFEDGNGRIGRAVAEKALSQTMGRPVLLSISQTIEADKKSYYSALKNAQRSNEITDWIKYFINIIVQAQKQASVLIDLSLRKTKFFDRFKKQLNDRQQKVLLKMFDAEPKGFEGGMTAKKYISITGTSKATATRDLQNLVQLGIIISTGAGRSNHYLLKLQDD